MTSILDKITRYNVPAPQAIATPAHEHAECNEFDHDALHCEWCSTEKKMLQALVIMSSQLQRLIILTKDASGMPHGDPVVVAQDTPVTNTIYYSLAVPQPSVLRSLSFTGNGNVSIYVNSPHYLAPKQIARNGCNGGTVSLSGMRVRIPAGGTIGIKSESSTASLLSMTALIEPLLGMTGEEQFRGMQ